MTNKFLLNRSGMSSEVTCRKGRHAIESIVSRFSLASLICLCMLTVGVGQMWGDALAKSSLNFGTPAISETFENVNSVSTRGNTSTVTNVTTYTTYGCFTNGYIGRAASIGYDVKTAATPMTSKYLEIIASTKGAGMCFSRTFATKGAYSFKIAKSSVTYIGLYNNTGLMSSGNLDAYTKAKCSVYLYFTGSAIQINSGSGWVNVVTDMSDLPNVFDVTVVYNNTATAATYNNGNTSLAAKTAHIFVDGSAIMNGSSPKAFTIPGATLGGFRILNNVSSSSAKVDDINIYDALPTAASTCTDPSAPENSSITSTGATISEGTSGNYNIYYSTSASTPSSSTSALATISSGTSVDISGLKYGTTYYYWAQKDCGGGSVSNYVAGSPTSFTTSCPAPTSIAAGTITNNGATFTITDNNSPKINSFGSGYGYDIYWNTSNTPAPDGNTTPSASTTALSESTTSLAAGTTYYYWVRGKGPNAKSSWVSGGNFTTLHEYTLSYKETDETANGSGTVVENATSFTNTSAPSKTGHDLEGFYAENTLTTKVANNSRQFVANVSSWTGTGGAYAKGANANLYLKWTPQTYTISSSLSGCSWETDIADASYEYTGDANAVSGTVNPSSGKGCPSSITVTMGGSTLTPSTDYTWSVNTVGVGTFLLKKVITGNVVVTITAQPMVKWMAGGQVFASKIGASGTALTNPGTPDNGVYCDGTKVFVGWSASNIGATPTNTEPTDLFPSADATSLTIPAEGKSYYAVFATVTGTYGKFKRVTSINASTDIAAGQQIAMVGYDGKKSVWKMFGINAAGTAYAETDAPTETSSQINTPGKGFIWTLSKDGSYWIFTNKQTTTKKIATTGTGSSLSFSTQTYYKWAYGENSDESNTFYWLLHTSSLTNYALQRYNATWQTYNGSYTDGAGFKFKLYVPDYTASGYVTTCGTTYTVTKAGSGTVTGGTFTASPTTAIEDATITLEATPSADYRFGSWTITNTSSSADITNSVSLSGQTASATFSMPAANVTVTPTFVAKCQTPTFNVAAGTYNNDQTVTISCATAGVTIKYTTDGRDPATYGTTYSTPVTINADNTTLKAVAIKAGHENSEVASATYRLKCATPTFTPTPGLVDSKYLGTQSVAFNTTTTGSITFYYTTDGSTTPTTSSTEYSSAIDVSSTTTLKAIATKANYQNSDVATQTFTITNAYTVTWMNRGSLLTTTRVEEGEKPTFPTTAKTGCDTYTSFYGWANNTWNGGKTTIAAPPAGLAAYTTSSAMPDVDGDVTYHAVWTNSFRNVHTSNLTLPGSSPTYGIKCQIHVESGDGYASYTAFKLGKTDQTSANITVTVPANTTYLSLHGVGWNSGTAGVVVSTEAEGVEITTATSPTTLQQQYNARGNITTSDDILFSDGHDFVEYSLSGVSTATTLTIASSGYPIIIWGINSATASGAPKYITSCCTPVSDRNAAVTAYDDESVTVRWDAVDNISSWAIVAKRTSDASTTGISIGDITTPTTGKRQCVISGLQPNTGYTITINGTAASGYCDTSDELTQTTTCATPSPSITQTVGTPDLCAGQAFTLSCSGGATGATYQWKRNGSNIGGATNSTYAVASATRANAGTYTCTVTNPGSGSCTATSGDYSIKVWTLYINNGDADAFQHVNFTNTGTGTGSNTTVFLTSDKGYEFKVNNGYEESGNWYGNPGTITTDVSNWVFAGDKGNCKLTSGIEGNYTFSINYSSSSSPTVSVSYPHADQPNNRSIWFDKSVVTGWNSEGTSDLYYRIGKSTNHTNNTKTGGTAWTLVPGTDKFYTTKTMAYDGFEAWAISNNAAWCADADDNHSIYGNATDGYKITKAIDFQKYVVGASGVTIVPTAYHNTDGNSCDYWSVTKTDGMLTHTATITTPTNGTITISNTDQSLSETTTTADLPHRTILTVTATPATGYNLTSLTVNDAAFTSGNTHILAADATIAATFTAKVITVTWNVNGGNTLVPGMSSYTYDGDALVLPTPTKDGKVFVGWYTLAEGGDEVTNVGGANKPTADVEYFAHWSDGNRVVFHPGAGTVSPDVVTQATVGGSVTLSTPTPTCDGWTFQGWKVGSAQTDVTVLPDGLLAGGSSYVPASATVDMYAVYKKTFEETAPVTRTYSWDGTVNAYWTISPNDVTRITSNGIYKNSGQFTGDHSFTFDSKVKVKSVSFKFLRSSNNTDGALWICKSTTNTSGSWDDTGVCGVREFDLPASKDEFQTYQTTNTDFDGETEYYVRIEYQSGGSGATRYIDDISVTYNDVSSVTHYVTNPSECSQVATPVITPEGDDYTGAQSITISCETDAATIRYTTDGTDPSSSVGTVIASGSSFALSCSGTVKAIAYKDGLDDSEIASETYTLTVPDPTFSPDGGDFKVAQSVSISDALAGTTVYYEYTTDGSEPSDPTESSTAYSSTIPVAVGQTVRIKAIGINACCENSAIVSKTFRVGWDFELVTDEDDLNVGDKIVVLSGTTNALSTYNTAGNNRTSSSDFDISGTTVTAYPPSTNSSTTVQVITLAGEPGAWKLVTSATQWLNCPSAGKLTTVTTDGSGAEDLARRRWSIDIGSSPNYYATIQNNQETTATIQYGTVFAAYATDQYPVKIYSLPNPDPVLKVEGTLSAFAGCTSAASAAQSFYVSGKNLSASILVTAPTGYEVSLSSGSDYASSVEVARVGTTVSKTQIYVRLKAGDAGAVAANNIVVSVEANSLSQNVAIPVSAIYAADTYVDRMHGNSTTYECGSYSAPNLSDDPGSTGTDCQKTYLTFQGWVAASDVNLDGTLKAGATVISNGTAMTADGTTYYSVWGEED